MAYLELDKHCQMIRPPSWQCFPTVAAFSCPALLIKGAEINHQSKTGSTALLVASDNGHEGIVKELLIRGAAVDLRSNTGWTALMLSSQNGFEDIVQALLAKGAKVDSQATMVRPP